jgi:hypothetical protein
MGTAQNQAFQNECENGLRTLLSAGMVQRCRETQWRLKMPDRIWLLKWPGAEMAFFTREDATGYAFKVHGPLVGDQDASTFMAGDVTCELKEVGCFTYSGSLSKRQGSEFE